MKKAIFVLTILGFMAGTVLVSCKSSSKTEEDTAKETQPAMQPATAEEWQDFNNQINAKINANSTQIAEMRMKTTGTPVDSLYSKQIDDLESRNRDLKMRISDYKNDGTSDWNSFKRESEQEAAALEQAIKNTSSNKK